MDMGLEYKNVEGAVRVAGIIEQANTSETSNNATSQFILGKLFFSGAKPAFLFQMLAHELMHDILEFSYGYGHATPEMARIHELMADTFTLAFSRVFDLETDFYFEKVEHASCQTAQGKETHKDHQEARIQYDNIRQAIKISGMELDHLKLLLAVLGVLENPAHHTQSSKNILRLAIDRYFVFQPTFLSNFKYFIRHSFVIISNLKGYRFSSLWNKTSIALYISVQTNKSMLDIKKKVLGLRRRLMNWIYSQRNSRNKNQIQSPLISQIQNNELLSLLLARRPEDQSFQKMIANMIEWGHSPEAEALLKFSLIDLDPDPVSTAEKLLFELGNEAGWKNETGWGRKLSLLSGPLKPLLMRPTKGMDDFHQAFFGGAQIFYNRDNFEAAIKSFKYLLTNSEENKKDEVEQARYDIERIRFSYLLLHAIAVLSRTDSRLVSTIRNQISKSPLKPAPAIKPVGRILWLKNLIFNWLENRLNHPLANEYPLITARLMFQHPSTLAFTLSDKNIHNLALSFGVQPEVMEQALQFFNKKPDLDIVAQHLEKLIYENLRTLDSLNNKKRPAYFVLGILDPYLALLDLRQAMSETNVSYPQTEIDNLIANNFSELFVMKGDKNPMETYIHQRLINDQFSNSLQEINLLLLPHDFRVLAFGRTVIHRISKAIPLKNKKVKQIFFNQKLGLDRPFWLLGLAMREAQTIEILEDAVSRNAEQISHEAGQETHFWPENLLLSMDQLHIDRKYFHQIIGKLRESQFAGKGIRNIERDQVHGIAIQGSKQIYDEKRVLSLDQEYAHLELSAFLTAIIYGQAPLHQLDLWLYALLKSYSQTESTLEKSWLADEIQNAWAIAQKTADLDPINAARTVQSWARERYNFHRGTDLPGLPNLEEFEPIAKAINEVNPELNITHPLISPRNYDKWAASPVENNLALAISSILVGFPLYLLTSDLILTIQWTNTIAWLVFFLGGHLADLFVKNKGRAPPIETTRIENFQNLKAAASIAFGGTLLGFFTFLSLTCDFAHYDCASFISQFH
jgi:hypothetical protein